mmetsp:Transcript_105288/g.255616  ORF Transcript_105288/g.255616 Transcript_105288/m.255616 type:complete len:322 (-) Transcript_105288:202-1167(-)
MVFGIPGWIAAISVCVCCSFLTVVSFVLQKRAVTAKGEQWRVGDMVLSWQWLAGLVFLFTGIPGDLLAYSLAPMSLTTPLSGVSVALNTVMAPYLLGERLQPSVDIPASLLIVQGAALTSAAGVHQDRQFSVSVMWELLLSPVTVSYLMGTLMVGITCIAYMHQFHEEMAAAAVKHRDNPKVKEMLLPAVSAAVCAGYSNVGLKALGVMLHTGSDSSSTAAYLTTIWLPVTIIAAVVQLNFVNRGLKLYQQTIFLPIYKSVLIVSNTAAGLVFYQEYQALLADPMWFGLFICGVASITVGIGLFRFRREPVEVDQEAFLGV